MALLQEPHIALLCLEVQTSLGVLGWEYFTDKGIQKGTKKSAKQTFRHEVRNPDPERTAMVNCDFEKNDALLRFAGIVSFPTDGPARQSIHTRVPTY